MVVDEEEGGLSASSERFKLETSSAGYMISKSSINNESLQPPHPLLFYAPHPPHT